MGDIAGSFGLECVDIADDPWLVGHWARELAGRPALMNVRTCRDVWHVGSGSDGAPEWNRRELTLQKVSELGLTAELAEIDRNTQRTVEKLWAQRLQIRSEN